ncbi:hypothetical protein BGZ61DRAFT_472175 [Ilyonectria robusta]|uniref:uncharacterized protein n=1 Tax=Ilyonectria robusta TaxID=1079257 RepID=UPI001E8E7950|nr:uncharacterized protein BGZ61DRAFT_472175 [Ilyonectria robusta]KAH8735778.1 hypothetical protein BGZ61DRAFT_472175 [Ilyonectria robusta]
MDNLNGKTALADWRRHSLVPPSWEDTVRVVSIDESAAAGRSLAHSFATDAMSRYVLDGDDMADYSDEHKWKLHVDIMTYMVAGHVYKGVVTAIGPDYDAVALWLPPGKNMEDWWTVFRSGMWRLWYQLSPEGRRRYFDEMIPVLNHTKEEVMADRDSECYYLVYLGTKPNARGKGYAGKLIRAMIEKADAENRPVYLESSNELTNAYYAKFGFEVKRIVVFERGRDPVQLYIMVREPQAPKPEYSAAPVLLPALGGVKV